jgi:hypothetical protein
MKTIERSRRAELSNSKHHRRSKGICNLPGLIEGAVLRPAGALPDAFVKDQSCINSVGWLHVSTFALDT